MLLVCVWCCVFNGLFMFVLVWLVLLFDGYLCFVVCCLLLSCDLIFWLLFVMYMLFSCLCFDLLVVCLFWFGLVFGVYFLFGFLLWVVCFIVLRLFAPCVYCCIVLSC